jgi:DNA segregation ATPase FtsK/SpoIIIE, S-DNA-T family
MKLRVTFRRETGPRDIQVTCDATTTVGELASFLQAADPQARPGKASADLTLALPEHHNRVLASDSAVAESGLRSGQAITLARSGEGFRDTRSDAAAVLTVVEGPDRGREYPLASGANVVGRMKGCAVQLSDGMASRQHARINITDVPEVIDLGSANGVMVNGAPIERQALRAGDVVVVGDTSFTVRMTTVSATEGRVETTAVGFIRSPRLVKSFEGQKFEAPEVPQRPQKQRFPMLTLLAPLLMGGVLFWVTKQVSSLIFIALTPLMMIGSYLEQRFGGRAAAKRDLEFFRGDLKQLVADMEAAATEEVASRLVEHPSATECIAATRELTNLLWTRRPDAPGFVEFRLGLGEQPSRSSVEVQPIKNGYREIHQELVKAVAPLATVPGVPAVATPQQSGGIGVAGPRSASAAVARAIMVQAASLHSPNDLIICSVVSARTSKDWDFLKWLPHCHSSASPLDVRHLASTSQGAGSLIGQLEELLEERAESKEAALLPAVLLLVESDAPVTYGRLIGLVERGWAHGIFVLWVASSMGELPAACRTFVDVRTLDSGEAGYLHTGDLVTPLAVDSVSIDTAREWSRWLAPVADLAAPSDDATDLPRSTNLLSLLGAELASDTAAVIDRWLQNRSVVTGPYAPPVLAKKAGTLRAVVGQSASGLHALDLRTDGPHALVGGTTGSGKSELLQTWILAMAASHSPQRLNFLLVDYKGGSAFAECNQLPHTVGLVTDLDGNGVRRALVSLSAELRFREKLLHQYKAKDLVTLEKSHPEVAPPSLVLVVDEFAALIQEVPEFVDGVVNVAQRGRSLGLHLILATQRPAGVIKDNLRANTNLRLALRVADVDDSNDVLGSPQAAYFDQDVPGRAVSKTGPGRLVSFQTGYVGGHTRVEKVAGDIAVEDLTFEVPVVWERTVQQDDMSVDLGPTDITALVASIGTAHQAAELPVPRKPWLPDLKAHYDLADRETVPTTRSDTHLVFGVADDPDHQTQPSVGYFPDKDGNLAIFGASGSGKTTMLRSLAVAAGFVVRGGPCHVYGLDFGSRGLTVLEELPHVGKIIAASDDERVQRLLIWLRETIDERAARYSAKNASTITQYRAAAQRPDEPRIIVLVDGMSAFRQAYDQPGRYRFWEMFEGIASDGRGVGVHVIVSADQRAALSSALFSSVQRRVVMRMADSDSYSALGVSDAILTAKSHPGRAIVDDMEVQVALLGPDGEARNQAQAIRKFGEAMRRAKVPTAPTIERLPESIDLSTLRAEKGWFALGVESERFATVSVRASGSFLLAGPGGSGRSTALETIVRGLTGTGGISRVVVFSDRRTPLNRSPLVQAAIGADECQTKADELVTEIRALPEMAQRIAIVIENMGDLGQSSAGYSLEELVKVAITQEHFVLGEGEPTSLAGSYSLLSPFKAGRRGLLLQYDDRWPDLVPGSLPTRSNSADYCVGRGFYLERGLARMMQVAM